MTKYVEKLKEDRLELLRDYYACDLPKEEVKWLILRTQLMELDSAISYYSSMIPKDSFGIVEDEVGTKRLQIIRHEKDKYTG